MVDDGALPVKIGGGAFLEAVLLRSLGADLFTDTFFACQRFDAALFRDGKSAKFVKRTIEECI